MRSHAHLQVPVTLFHERQPWNLCRGAEKGEGDAPPAHTRTKTEEHSTAQHDGLLPVSLFRCTFDKPSMGSHQRAGQQQVLRRAHQQLLGLLPAAVPPPPIHTSSQTSQQPIEGFLGTGRSLMNRRHGGIILFSRKML